MRIFKKISSIILALCMAISLFAVPATAAEVDVTNAISLSGKITKINDTLDVNFTIPEGISEIRGIQFHVELPEGFAISSEVEVDKDGNETVVYDIETNIPGWKAHTGSTSIVIIECGAQYEQSLEKLFPENVTNSYNIATLGITTDKTACGENGQKIAKVTVLDITSGVGEADISNPGNTPVDVPFALNIVDCKNHIYNIQKHDDQSHWFECECGDKDLISIQGHAFSRNYDATYDWQDCDCGYKTDIRKHHLVKRSDGSKHWQECTCGYTTTKVNHTLVKKNDAYKHWQECTCGYATTKVNHAYGKAYVVTQATLSRNGLLKKKCACGHIADAGTISRIKSVSVASFAYTGKAAKPKVTVKDAAGKTISSSNYTVKCTSKKVGKATAIVTFKNNYSGSKKVTFKIVPKTTKISSLKAGKKSFTVKYKKQTSGSGYEIQYSTSSKFKSAKTVKISKNKTVSKTVKKLKSKKTYYVRVRVTKGSSYKSSWSAVKKVKVK